MLDPIEILRQRCAGKDQSAAAKALDVSPQYLSDVLNQRRKPGPKILKALGLIRVMVYQRFRNLPDETYTLSQRPRKRKGNGHDRS